MKISNSSMFKIIKKRFWEKAAKHGGDVFVSVFKSHSGQTPPALVFAVGL